MTERLSSNLRRMPASLAGLFLLCRLMLLIALPLEGLRGFGDFAHFFGLARLGRPFLDYWVEFPPVFPFFSRLLYTLSGGREHVYDYLLALALTLCQAACIYVFANLAERSFPAEAARRRTWVFFALLLVLPYGWWYFDPLAVLALLLGLAWILEGRAVQAGIVVALGLLTKWFPALLLATAWHWLPGRKAASLTAAALGIPILILGALYLASPELTSASLRSQAAKGSWETVWALIDGNFNTGNFGPLSERLDPQAASIGRGNPPRFPTYVTLIPFALAGLFLFLRARPGNPQQATAFLGLTCSLFFLWSPGWSPQWVLYLLPLILLALPEREGSLAAIALVLVNLLEWPVLLSRGYFQGLLATIPVRTLLIGLLVILFYQEIPFCSSLVTLKRSLR